MNSLTLLYNILKWFLKLRVGMRGELTSNSFSFYQQSDIRTLQIFLKRGK